MHTMCTDIYLFFIFSNVEKKLYLGKYLPNKQHRAEVFKISKQSWYASIENMKKLIKNDGLFDTQLGKIITDIVQQCQNCR